MMENTFLVGYYRKRSIAVLATLGGIFTYLSNTVLEQGHVADLQEHSMLYIICIRGNVPEQCIISYPCNRLSANH